MFIAICKQLKLVNYATIIALYIIYIWLIVFILTSYTFSSLRLGHFMMKKD